MKVVNSTDARGNCLATDAKSGGGGVVSKV
jgi:hypothetical protein